MRPKSVHDMNSTPPRAIDRVSDADKGKSREKDAAELHGGRLYAYRSSINLQEMLTCKKWSHASAPRHH